MAAWRVEEFTKKAGREARPNQNNAEETLLRKCSRTMEQPVKNLESCSHYESQEERA